MMSVVQVLRALSVPGSAPDVAKHLRQAAALLGKEKDTSRWLASDLVPKVLGILCSLPVSLPPRDAVQVCAAAAAVLQNMLDGLCPSSAATTRFRAMIAADKPACCALVHWCLVCPEATQQLPASHDDACASGNMGNSTKAAGLERPALRTPFAYCVSLLASICTAATKSTSAHPEGVLCVLCKVVSPELVAHALALAQRDPTCESLLFLPTCAALSGYIVCPLSLFGSY
jgi:hypothetical protein